MDQIPGWVSPDTRGGGWSTPATIDPHYSPGGGYTGPVFTGVGGGGSIGNAPPNEASPEVLDVPGTGRITPGDTLPVNAPPVGGDDQGLDGNMLLIGGGLILGAAILLFGGKGK